MTAAWISYPPLGPTDDVGGSGGPSSQAPSHAKNEPAIQIDISSFDEEPISHISNEISSSVSGFSDRDSDASSLSSSSARRFKHYEQTSSPQTLSQFQDALDSGDDELLSRITRDVGAPSELRRNVWPALLSRHPYVLRPNMPVQEASGIPLKRIAGELRRLRQRHRTTDPEDWEAIQEAVRGFLEKWSGRTKYESSMLWIAHFLCAAVQIPREELAVNFERLMLVFGWGGDLSPIISKFIGQLRLICPQIGKHFDAEDILNSLGGDEWLAWWISGFGVRAWAAGDVARIWDIYIAWRPPLPPPRLVHVYACVAVMKSQSAKLLELDQSEVRQLLSKVPPCIDPEMLVQETNALLEAQES